MEENKRAVQGATGALECGEEIMLRGALLDVPEVYPIELATEAGERLLDKYIEAFRYLAK
jgi:hypothetical protein